MSGDRPAKRARVVQDDDAGALAVCESGTGSTALRGPCALQLRRLCLQRDTLARWCKSPVFEKLVRNKLVRVTSADGTHTLHVVTGLDKTSEPYPLDFVLSSRDIPAGGQYLAADPPFSRLEKKLGSTPPPAPPGYDTFRVSTAVKLRTVPALAPVEGGKGAGGGALSLRLSMVSNAAPTSEELAGVSSSPSIALLDAPSASRLCEEVERVVAEAGAGLGVVVSEEGGDAHVGWGSKDAHVAHHVLLILRSWLVQDALDEDRSVGVWAKSRVVQPAEGGGGGGGGGAAPTDAESLVPEIFRPCVEGVGEGRGVDEHGYGPGPLRTMERVAGQFRYALQVRVGVGGGKGGRGQDGTGTVPGGIAAALGACGLSSTSATVPACPLSSFLAPLSLSSSHSYDEGQPCLTAWRAVRQYLDEDVPLALLRDAVVAQVDVREGVEVAVAARQAQGGAAPASSPSPPPAPTHPTPCLLTPAGHPVSGRGPCGPVLAFVIDADVLAEGMAGRAVHGSGGVGVVRYSRLASSTEARAWLRRVFGTQPDVATGGVGMGVGEGGGCTAPATHGTVSTCSNPRIAKLVGETGRKEGAGGSGAYRDGAEWGEGTAGSTSLTPTSLLWLDEDQLEHVVRGGSVEVGPAPCAVPLCLHPSAASALLPFSVEHPSCDVAQDRVQPGGTLFEDGDLPDAAQLSEALISQNFTHRVRQALHTRGQGGEAGGGGSAGGTDLAPRVHAHQLPFWPPWPTYPLRGPRRGGSLIPPAPPGGGGSGEGVGGGSLPPPSFAPTWCPSLFPHRNGRHNTVLYHGTSTGMGGKIAAEGFRRATCRMLPACFDGRCDDQMLGFGTYFGERGKAFEYAVKRSTHDTASGKAVAALVVARVDLGHVACAPRAPCPCGCGQLYVDHYGAWYTRGGADSLYLQDGSLPAARTREWAVADPARTVVARVEEVATSGGGGN